MNTKISMEIDYCSKLLELEMQQFGMSPRRIVGEETLQEFFARWTELNS